MTGSTSHRGLVLDPTARVVAGTGGLHLVQRRGAFQLRGKNLASLHERLAPILDGRFTRNELLASVGPHGSVVDRYLDGLSESGVLLEGEPPTQISSERIGSLKRPSSSRAALALAAAAALASPASFAHHSPAVFDLGREIVVKGVVTEFHWGQPHCWIHMNVSTDAGAVQAWTIEMDPASHLRRRGWNAKTVQPGDRIAVTVHPLRSGEIGGQYVSVELPGGKVMDASYTGPQVLDK